jgi:hypothetical protein
VIGQSFPDKSALRQISMDRVLLEQDEIPRFVQLVPMLSKLQPGQCPAHGINFRNQNVRANSNRNVICTNRIDCGIVWVIASVGWRND